MTKEKLLTFVLSDDKDELEIQMNASGLDDLIYYLQRLRDSVKPLPNHDHLMTESWAGTELSEENARETGSVIHKVTLRYLD